MMDAWSRKETACLRGVLVFLLPAVFLALVTCSGESGEDSGTGQGPFALDIAALYSTAGSVMVQVAYEPGAEPFTGTTLNGTPSWTVLEDNIRGLFQGRMVEPDVSIPMSLDEMEQLPVQSEETWTASEIMGLASDIWEPLHLTTTAEFFVLFLNGYLDEEGEGNIQVIGVSIVGTPVIAVFKDVIRASGSSSTVLAFVEQATLVHEFGHVMGLVDNGIPMVSDHLDADHPRHCTDEDCVMYWLNEGAADLRLFVQQMLVTDSLVMFGDECLDDTRSYLP